MMEMINTWPEPETLDIRDNLSQLSQSEIDETLAPFLGDTEAHTKNPHILTVEKPKYLILGQHSHVHMIHCMNVGRDAETNTFLESETDFLVRDYLYHAHLQKMDHANRYVPFGEISARHKISAAALNEYPYLNRLRTLQAHLREAFTYATGTEPKREEMFIEGTAPFGESTPQEFHVDRHAVSEEDIMAENWGGPAAKPKFIMLETAFGDSTEIIADRHDIDEGLIASWDEMGPDSFHDEVARFYGAQSEPAQVTTLFKTTALHTPIQPFELSQCAMVHRVPQIMQSAGRVTLAYTDLDR